MVAKGRSDNALRNSSPDTPIFLTSSTDNTRALHEMLMTQQWFHRSHGLQTNTNHHGTSSNTNTSTHIHSNPNTNPYHKPLRAKLSSKTIIAASNNGKKKSTLLGPFFATLGRRQPSTPLHCMYDNATLESHRMNSSSNNSSSFSGSGIRSNMHGNVRSRSRGRERTSSSRRSASSAAAVPVTNARKNQDRSSLQDLLETEMEMELGRAIEQQPPQHPHRVVGVPQRRLSSRRKSSSSSSSHPTNDAIAQVILSQAEQQRRKDLELTKARAKFFAEEAAESLAISSSNRRSPMNMEVQESLSSSSRRIVRKSSSSSIQSVPTGRSHSQTTRAMLHSSTSNLNDYSSSTTSSNRHARSSLHSSRARDVIAQTNDEISWEASEFNNDPPSIAHNSSRRNNIQRRTSSSRRSSDSLSNKKEMNDGHSVDFSSSTSEVDNFGFTSVPKNTFLLDSSSPPHLSGRHKKNLRSIDEKKEDSYAWMNNHDDEFSLFNKSNDKERRYPKNRRNNVWSFDNTFGEEANDIDDEISVAIDEISVMHPEMSNLENFMNSMKADSHLEPNGNANHSQRTPTTAATEVESCLFFQDDTSESTVRSDRNSPKPITRPQEQNYSYTKEQPNLNSVAHFNAANSVVSNDNSDKTSSLWEKDLRSLRRRRTVNRLGEESSISSSDTRRSSSTGMSTEMKKGCAKVQNLNSDQLPSNSSLSINHRATSLHSRQSKTNNSRIEESDPDRISTRSLLNALNNIITPSEAVSPAKKQNESMQVDQDEDLALNENISYNYPNVTSVPTDEIEPGKIPSTRNHLRAKMRFENEQSFHDSTPSFHQKPDYIEGDTVNREDNTKITSTITPQVQKNRDNNIYYPTSNRISSLERDRSRMSTSDEIISLPCEIEQYNYKNIAAKSSCKSDDEAALNASLPTSTNTINIENSLSSTKRVSDTKLDTEKPKYESQTDHGIHSSKLESDGETTLVRHQMASLLNDIEKKKSDSADKSSTREHFASYLQNPGLAILSEIKNRNMDDVTTDLHRKKISLVTNPMPALLQNIKERGAPKNEERNSKQSNVSSEISSIASDNVAFNGRPAVKNDPEFAKFFKMLKVGIPLPAVKQAMEKDGLDGNILDNDHNKPLPADDPKEKDISKNFDPVYDKYFKMLKVGIPLPAVKQAVVKDGLDPSRLDGGSDSSNTDGVPLKDDPKFAKYFKMLAIGLPLGATKQAMMKDGLDPSILDGDHNSPAKSINIERCKLKPKKAKDKHRRTRLHWESLQEQEISSRSVWALVNDDEDIDNIHIDEHEFDKLFKADITVTKKDTSSNSSGKGPKQGAVKVIDPKRANNGGIILARIKYSYEEIATAINSMDDSLLTSHQMQSLIEYLPTEDEKRSLKAFLKGLSGPDLESKIKTLCECEKFMLAMTNVKNPERMIKSLVFKSSFSSLSNDVENDAIRIENACDQLLTSIRLRKLLGIVLNIGNRVNTAGTPSSENKVGAFSLDSLLKLNQAKAVGDSSKKMTFLHYIVMVVRRNNAHLLNFHEDLVDVFKAERINLELATIELGNLGKQLALTKEVALAAVPGRWNLKNVEIRPDEEVQALRSTAIGRFIIEASKRVQDIGNLYETASEKYSMVLDYFGESKRLQPHELFSIFVKFCDSFRATVIEVDRLEKAKMRDEKKRNAQTPMESSAQKATKHTYKSETTKPILAELKDRMNNLKSTPEMKTTPSASNKKPATATSQATGFDQNKSLLQNRMGLNESCRKEDPRDKSINTNTSRNNVISELLPRVDRANHQSRSERLIQMRAQPKNSPIQFRAKSVLSQTENGIGSLTNEGSGSKCQGRYPSHNLHQSRVDNDGRRSKLVQNVSSRRGREDVEQRMTPTLSRREKFDRATKSKSPPPSRQHHSVPITHAPSEIGFDFELD